MTSLGQTLREEREARNISLEEIASASKIGLRYLEALECDRLDRMPGGFFIRGIIRTYAKAIGLDGDEVLARYREAGLLGQAETKRHVVPMPAPEPVPLPPPAPAPQIADAAAVDLLLPPESAPRAERKPVPDLIFEAAPKPGLSPAARKRIFSWIWRSAATVAIIAAIVLLWASRRPRPPQGQATTPAVPADAVGDQGAVPASQITEPAAVPPASKPDLPPVVKEVWKGVTIEISFQAETWLRIYADGVLKVDGLFPAGATARAQADALLLIDVGNAGGFAFLLNGKPAKSLGRSGQVRTEIRITPENYEDFLQGPSPGQPAG